MNMGLRLIAFLLSPLFHSDYGHITRNLGLLIPLSLVTEYDIRWRSLKHKVLVYSICLFTSTWFPSSIPFFTGGMGCGLSIANMWIAILYCSVVVRQRNGLFSRAPLPRIVRIMFVGLAILSGSYNYLVEAIAYPYASSTWEGLYVHTFFGLVVSMVVIWGLFKTRLARSVQI